MDLILAFVFAGLDPHPTRIINLPENFYLRIDFWLQFIFLIILQIVAVVYVARKNMSNEKKIQFYPEYLGPKNDSRLGAYTPERLIELVKNMEEKTGKSVKKGYISLEVLPKIVSHYIPGIGNYLYLNNNLLQICGEEELTAAIAIEFKSFNSINNTLITFLNFHTRVFLTILFLRLFSPAIITFLFTILGSPGYAFNLQSVTSIGWIFIALLIITLVLWQVMSLIIKSAYLNAHYIADIEAARVVGKNNTINMLVKLGQRSEALDILLEEIKWLEEKRIGKVYEFDEEKLKEILEIFPHNEISEHVAREQAPVVFLKSRLTQLTDYYHVEIPNLDQIIDKAADKLREERKKFVEERKAKLEELGKKMPVDETIDWRKFDVDGNLHLDEKEIDIFVNELKTSKKLLFENELVGDAFFKKRPPINKRIINLYETKI